jgi:hypothetical protein
MEGTLSIAKYKPRFEKLVFVRKLETGKRLFMQIRLSNNSINFICLLTRISILTTTGTESKTANMFTS